MPYVLLRNALCSVFTSCVPCDIIRLPRLGKETQVPKKATAEPWHYFGTIKIVDDADEADEPKQKKEVANLKTPKITA